MCNATKTSWWGNNATAAYAGFELVITKWFPKILRVAGEHPPWFGAILTNFEKFTPLDALKNYLHGFFALNKQGKWKANVIMLLKRILSFFLIFLAHKNTFQWIL